MQKLLFTLVGLFILSSELLAQGGGQVVITNCYIRYQYDAAGNRVKRDFYCYYDPISSKSLPLDSTQTIADDLMVYPNPASTSFTIVLPSGIEQATAVLYNASGQTLHTQAISSSSAVVNTHALPAGVYMLIVHTERNKYYRRVVVEK